MATMKWAVTCQRIITDGESNSVSYIDAIEELVVPSLPLPLPPIHVGTVWERARVGETFRIRLRGVDPRGNELGVINATLEDPSKIRHRANFTLFLLAQTAGPYEFVVEQLVDEENWKEEARIVIPVRIAEQALVGEADAPVDRQGSSAPIRDEVTAEPTARRRK